MTNSLPNVPDKEQRERQKRRQEVKREYLDDKIEDYGLEKISNKCPFCRKELSTKKSEQLRIIDRKIEIGRFCKSCSDHIRNRLNIIKSGRNL